MTLAQYSKYSPRSSNEGLLHFSVDESSLFLIFSSLSLSQQILRVIISNPPGNLLPGNSISCEIYYRIIHSSLPGFHFSHKGNQDKSPWSCIAWTKPARSLRHGTQTSIPITQLRQALSLENYSGTDKSCYGVSSSYSATNISIFRLHSSEELGQ